MMQLVVNPSAELPIYRQIMRQITEAIAGGRLKAGQKLASHRELSEQIVVAPLTVKKAYDELEALGFIETSEGAGRSSAPACRGSTAKSRPAGSGRKPAICSRRPMSPGSISPK